MLTNLINQQLVGASLKVTPELEGTSLEQVVFLRQQTVPRRRTYLLIENWELALKQSNLVTR